MMASAQFCVMLGRAMSICLATLPCPLSSARMALRIGSGDSDIPQMEYSLQTLVEHVAGFIEFEHAAMVEARRQPLVGRHLLDHPQPEGGLSCGEEL